MRLGFLFVCCTATVIYSPMTADTATPIKLEWLVMVQLKKMQRTHVATREYAVHTFELSDLYEHHC